MQIVEKKGNRESIYEVVYDQNAIKSLISEIIENCSIRRRTESQINTTENEIEKIKTLVSSIKDWNGNKVHENISGIKRAPLYDPCDYWRIGDPLPYSFTSDELLTPKLVYFLINLLEEKKFDYEGFARRKELNVKKELELEIKKIDSQINEISNFETERKINKLNELASRVSDLNNIPNFDYNLLSKYYDIAEKYIELVLIEEKITYQRKLSPSKLMGSKQD